METLPNKLFHPVQELATWPRWGQIKFAFANRKGEFSGTRLCGFDNHPLDEIHPVVVVTECPVGLESGELWAVSGVNSLVTEVSSNLEDSFVPANDQSLEVELGSNPQTQLNI